MKEYSKRPWTEKERKVLRNEYSTLTVLELTEKLPGRTENSIRKQVAYLRKRGWSF